jgi:hypothetical protein
MRKDFISMQRDYQNQQMSSALGKHLNAGMAGLEAMTKSPSARTLTKSKASAKTLHTQLAGADYAM